VPLKGHTQLPEGAHDAMNHPMCQRLWHNAVAWLARVDAPAKI